MIAPNQLASDIGPNRQQGLSANRLRYASPARERKQVRPVTALGVSLALVNLREGQPLVEALGNRSWGYLTAKRALDVAGACALIVLFSPIMLATLAVLMVTTQGHPLFIQRRVGFRGRLFPMIKFRTMHMNAANMQAQVANQHSGPIFKNRRDPRITAIGRLLRSSSVDEMPQLFNVLVGHMSLVGPRPPIATEVARYQPWQRQRLAVKPGLTCLWQVSGRSEIGFDDWVRMDLWYLKNQNLLTDLKLLVRTPASVLSGHGAY